MTATPRTLVDAFSFELRQHLRGRPFRVATAVLFLYWFFFTLKMGYDPNFWGMRGEVYYNAPIVLYFMFATQSFVTFAIAPVFMAPPMLRDLETGAAEWIYACPVNESGVLWGRFGAASVSFAAAVVLSSTAIVVAPLVAAHLELVEPGRVRAPNVGSLVSGWFSLLIPTVLSGSSIVFSLAVILRRFSAALGGTVVLVLAASMSHYFGKVARGSTILQLLDPTGFHALHEISRHWTIESRNSAALPLQGILLWNRLLWLGASAVVLTWAWTRFDRSWVLSSVPLRGAGTQDRSRGSRIPKTRQPRRIQLWPRFMSAIIRRLRESALLATQRFPTATLFVERYRFELGLLLRDPPLLASLGMCFAWTLVQTFGGLALGLDRALPTTATMLRSRHGLWMITLVMIPFAAVTTIFRERVCRIHEITGALPVPSRTVVGVKLAAVLSFASVVPLVVLIACLGTQATLGYWRLELDLYFFDLFVVYLPYLWQLGAFAFGIGLFATTRAWALVLVMVLLYTSVFAKEAGLIEHGLLLQLYPSRFDYSAFTGWWVQLNKAASYGAYWLSLGVVTVVVGSLLACRGLATDLPSRLRQARQRWSAAVLWAIGSWTLLAVCCAAWIAHNEITQNGYRSTRADLRARANYERMYGASRHDPAPRIGRVEGTLDLFPPERRAVAHLELAIQNDSNVALERLELEATAATELRLAGSVLPVTYRDRTHARVLYELPALFPPVSSLVLKAHGALDLGGFSAGANTQEGIAANGSFLRWDDLLRFGYNRAREIDVPRERSRFDLGERARRFPTVTGDLHRRRPSSEWDIELGTSASQRAISPGRLVSSRKRDGRAYFRYASEGPTRTKLVFLSGTYVCHRSPVGSVVVEICTLPDHQDNAPAFTRAAERGLQFMQGLFGAYPYSELRIAEVPKHVNAGAFSNLVVVPEDEGFVSDLRWGSPSVDYLVTRLIARQYWETALGPARARGKGVIARGVPEYLALRQVERLYGPGLVRETYVQRAVEGYFWYHGIHGLHEESLKDSGGNSFVDVKKAGLVLRRLSGQLEDGQFDRVLGAFFTQFRNRVEPPFAHVRALRAAIRRALQEPHAAVVEEVFSEVVHHRVALIDATSTQEASGQHATDLTLDCHRLRPSSTGGEEELAGTWPLEVAFSASPRESTRGKQEGRWYRTLQVRPGRQRVRVRSAVRPKSALLDPNRWLLEADTSDNLVEVGAR